MMSHLSHGNQDRAGGATAAAFGLDQDHAPDGLRFVSRKQSTFDVQPGREYEHRTDFRLPSRSSARRRGSSTFAEDYSWLVGTLGYREGPRGGWYLQYASPLDDARFGGRIHFANQQRLGILRPGDRIFVDGELVNVGRDEYRYQVDAFEVLSP